VSILDRYILRSFLSAYLTLLAVGIGLYVLGDALVNIDEFAGDRSVGTGEMLAAMADYYGHNLPLYFSQLSGPVMAIAAAFTLGVMLRNNEQTILVSCGTPLIPRVIVPILLGSVGLVAAWVANRELLIPAWAHKMARTHDDVLGRRVAGVDCARDDNRTILTALRQYPAAGALQRVYIVEPGPKGAARSLVVADAAEWTPERHTWKLQRGYRLAMDDPLGGSGVGDGIRRETVEEYPFMLSPQELQLRTASQWAELLSLRELGELLRSRNLPNRSLIAMSMHVRLTTPLVQWLLLLLAIPFFLSRERQHVLSAGGRALLVSGAFFLLSFVAQSVVKDDSLAAFTAWLPVLIFGPVAVLLLANVRT
jgi:lipopolysaccharide export LptBFGC system permease protein LptF